MKVKMAQSLSGQRLVLLLMVHAPTLTLGVNL